MERNFAISQLFERYLNGACTPEEVRQLLQHFKNAQNEFELRSLIQQHLAEDHEASSHTERLVDDIYRQIEQEIFSTHQVPVIPLRKRIWFRTAAAAVVILFMAGTAFWFFRQQQAVKHPVTASNRLKILKDLPPGRDNAILTLADGSRIVLDSASDGVITSENGMKVLKLNAQITYQNQHKNTNGNTEFNTITTARGNQYKLVLSDGSKVWLNAASSIRFPIQFTGNERKIEITGEAYFEVAKDPTKPFRVAAHGMEVEVLGTHFNINSYDDEPQMSTTLAEGRVKITREGTTRILRPGEQAGIQPAYAGISVKAIDVAPVLAWKEGYFWFDNTDIRSLMRQIARWYDVDVRFEGRIADDGFSGKIPRNISLVKLLNILALNEVHYKLEGRNLVITY